MAQLIKITDCISRYERDIYSYTSRYIRLKREKWLSLKDEWNNQHADGVYNVTQEIFLEDDWLKDDKKSFIDKIKGWITKHGSVEEESLWRKNWQNPITNKIKHYRSIEEMKKSYLDELFKFQLRWATTTLREKSVSDEDFNDDPTLKFFAQEFPDNFLLLYRPVVMIKSAPIELDIILAGPTSTFCIHLIESEDLEIYQSDRGRHWYKGYGDEKQKVINPLISLNRMSKVVEGIYKQNQIKDYPIKKVVLCRNGFLEDVYSSDEMIYIDKRTFNEWHLRMKRQPSPIKRNQLMACDLLLKNCQSTYIYRPEWETDSEEDNWI